jgi:hypothetical protein
MLGIIDRRLSSKKLVMIYSEIAVVFLSLFCFRIVNRPNCNHSVSKRSIARSSRLVGRRRR